MEKNYYDILEINENASPEIVEKAYKTLAKKYHPDLQEENLKQEYENKLELINEAYEVLSNEQKRIQYNLELKEKRSLDNQNINSNTTRNNNYENQTNYQNYEQPIHKDINEEQRRNQIEKQRKYEEEYNRQINNAINQAYHDAYIQDLKNRGYKIKYKKTFKDYIKNFITIIIVIFILFLLLQTPFVKNYFINLYNNNEIIQYLVNVFLNLKNT